MKNILKWFYRYQSRHILITLALLVCFFPAVHSRNCQKQINLTPENLDYSGFLISGENTLFAISDISAATEKTTIKQKISVVVTAYSSTVQQTDSTPFITASGKWVEEGIAANNLLPFGTKIRIPELYGDKTFVIEDRMNRRKGYYHVDIWFPSYWEALDFGAKRTYIEVLES